jgi:hypothetical protein
MAAADLLLLRIAGNLTVTATARCLRCAPTARSSTNCIIIAQFPIENHFKQGRCAELPLKTIGNVQSLGDYYAIRSSSQVRRAVLLRVVRSATAAV